jgi:CheY-like chemotaxis protein
MEAGDGTEALEVLRSSTPVDLLFTDVVMPGGWLGPDLAREARRLRPGIKVLLSSGYAEAAMDSGCHGGATEAVLHKPYRKKDLAQKVREVLSAPKA